MMDGHHRFCQRHETLRDTAVGDVLIASEVDNAKGSQFGDLPISTASGDQSQLAIYAALHSDNVLTVVLINKTAGALTSGLSLANLVPSGVGQTFVYSGPNLAAIQPGAPVVFSVQATAPLTLPAMSATLLAVHLSGTPYSAP